MYIYICVCVCVCMCVYVYVHSICAFMFFFLGVLGPNWLQISIYIDVYFLCTYRYTQRSSRHVRIPSLHPPIESPSGVCVYLYDYDYEVAKGMPCHSVLHAKVRTIRCGCIWRRRAASEV